MKNVLSFAELQSGLKNAPVAFLFLYKKGSEQSDCALERIEKIEQGGSVKLFSADVNVVRDIHTAYNIKSAPSLIEFENGLPKNIYKGCQTEQFYRSAISGEGFSSFKNQEGKKEKRVTVYTTPTCTWCNTIKTYLDESGIRYTEVDVASNPAKAEEMVRKSGQQGVPQTDINGQIVVGFDKKRINELLEIN
jgi:glutaredoxin-like YruB-family protein